MQQWEYIDLFLRGSSWADSTGRSGKLPATRIDGTNTLALSPVLNELGTEGWKVVGIMPGSTTTRIILTRPKE
jgi:hypothetical protein